MSTSPLTRIPHAARRPTLMLGGFAFLLTLACAQPPAERQRASAATMDVQTAAATMDDVRERLEAGGTVRARETATVTSRVLAPVREIRATPGMRVRAGQVLILLEVGDLTAAARRSVSTSGATEQAERAARAERDAAQATLALARATYDRMVTLHERRSATVHELDEARAALGTAEARVAMASARIDEAGAALAAAKAAADQAEAVARYGIITAPFDGVVTDKLIEVGNMAAPGTPLLRVDATGPARVDVTLDESRVRYVRVGDSVEIELEAGAGAASDTLSGTVLELARAMDAGSRSFLVKVSLPQETRPASGTFARARFNGPARRALRVPASAIVRQGQVATLFVVDDGTAHLRLVQLGASDAARVEIAAGLSQGERVVLDPPPALQDGAPVREASRSGHRDPASLSHSDGARQ